MCLHCPLMVEIQGISVVHHWNPVNVTVNNDVLMPLSNRYSCFPNITSKLIIKTSYGQLIWSMRDADETPYAL